MGQITSTADFARQTGASLRYDVALAAARLRSVLDTMFDEANGVDSY